MPNLNILSQRYASDEINYIFSEHGKTLFERELWIAVLKTQRELGIDIPEEAITFYEEVKEKIDLNLIKEIEEKTRHDIKAKIEAFNIAAGGKYELIHRTMTSRDLSDNVEQMQIKKACKIIFGKYVSVLRHFVEKSKEYDSIIITARTHHQPAQPTLLGRKFAMWAEELYYALSEFESFIETYPLRGMKGPVGTQFDMLTLLGSVEKVQELEQKIASYLGFKNVLAAPGQVYPRSLDMKLASRLSVLSSACESYALDMRLMSGYELVTEGFQEGQVGSSSMPHKMNTRSSERICGFSELLKMYADGASRLAGHQWEEGDVSCSVVRRVIIPDMFYVSDGLCETTLVVLNEMGTYPNVISAEVDKYLPFLATTELLNAATMKGMNREKAHELIRKHSVAEALRIRETGGYNNKLAKQLGDDSEFPLDEADIEKILEDKAHFVGNAKKQIYDVVQKTDHLIEKFKIEASYEPGRIL
jgi:adenylosuccinate lyase